MEQKKMDRINELARLKKERPLTEAELREYYSGIDHRLYSEVSEQLMERIYATFSAALADTRGGESR